MIRAELTFLFKGEVLREMPTFVVASEEEEGGRVVDLQGPQIEHTLQVQTEKACHKNTIAMLSYIPIVFLTSALILQFFVCMHTIS